MHDMYVLIYYVDISLPDSYAKRFCLRWTMAKVELPGPLDLRGFGATAKRTRNFQRQESRTGHFLIIQIAKDAYDGVGCSGITCASRANSFGLNPTCEYVLVEMNHKP